MEESRPTKPRAPATHLMLTRPATPGKNPERGAWINKHRRGGGRPLMLASAGMTCLLRAPKR